MQAVELTKDIPEQGLFKGDVLQVDELSAKSMIAAEKAKAYDPDDTEAAAEPEEVEYGGQKVRTIDDIVDPEAKRMKGVMHVQRLVGADPGPARSAAQAETATDTPEAAKPPDTTDAAAKPADVTSTTGRGRSGRGAPGADPAGGDAGGGVAGS